MSVIWKYAATEGLDKELQLVTKPGRIVHSVLEPLSKDRRQHVTLWIEHTEADVVAPSIVRRLLVVGTGHPFPEDGTQLLTVLDGMFVWHLIEMAPIV